MLLSQFRASWFASFCAFAVTTTAQETISCNCDYPTQMVANEPYEFVLITDSTEQRSIVTAIGDRKLRYDIVVSRKDVSLASGRLVEQVSGIAMWAGCFGGVGADGVLHPHSWEYRNVDGSMTITLFGEYVTHIQAALAPIITEQIPRVGYIDE